MTKLCEHKMEICLTTKKIPKNLEKGSLNNYYV